MFDGGEALPLAQVEDRSAEFSLLCDDTYHSKAATANWICSSLARHLQADSDSGVGDRPQAEKGQVRLQRCHPSQDKAVSPA